MQSIVVFMVVNKTLLQYAAPCAKEHLKNNFMAGEDYNLFCDALKGKEDFPSEKFKKYFPMVYKNLNPEKVTDREVRDYFFGEHKKTHPEPCRVFEAKVVKISEDEALVKKETGEELKAVVYTPELPREGQKVVYHRDGIVDILDL